jgi:rhamnosyltransferase
MIEELRRYFDIGVYHSREKWFIASLGKPEGEGTKFVFSEIRYLLQHAPLLIPSAIIRTGLKLFGYKLGQREQGMPAWLKRNLSMNKGFW